MIQDLGWTQLESTLKIMRVNVKNYVFGHDLTIGNMVNKGRCEDPQISETFTLEENASHHIT